MDVDVDADNGGWGRPRPKFEDLVPDSDPEPEPEPPVDGQGGSDDSTEDMTSGAPAGRVARLIDYPLAGYDGAPCGELNQLYVNEGYQVHPKKFYTVWDNEGEPHNREFTAIFTCPITGEHFASGNWANDKGVASKDGVHWYKKKQYAKIAAAAKYLDCASLRRCTGTEKEPYQRCKDAPHLPSDVMPKGLPSGVVLPTPHPIEDGAVEETEARPDSLTRRALHQWYLSFARKLVTIGIELEMPINESGPHADNYDCLSMRDGHNNLFTAIFTCNFTGERFASGKLVGKEGEYSTSHWYYNAGDQILFNTDSSDAEERLGLQKVNLVWYRTKKDAEDAAAGRAIDCLRFRDGSDNFGSTR
ncbi:hypothetical protein ACHAXT_007016 [Thalassiosira profunda]